MRPFAWSRAGLATWVLCASSGALLAWAQRAPSEPRALQQLDGLTRAYPGVRVLDVTAELGPDAYFFPSAIAPEGRLVGSIIDAQHRERELVVLDPTTGARDVVERLEDGEQILSAVVSADQIAWTRGDGEGARFRLRTRSLAGGPVRELAQNATFRGDPCPAPVSNLSAAAGGLYWSACALRGADVGLDTYRADLASGVVRELRRDAADPVALPDAVYLRVPSTTPDKAQLLRMGTHTRVVQGEDFADYTASTRLELRVAASFDAVFIRDHQTRDLHRAASASPVMPRALAEFATFSSDDGPRLYDADAKQLVRLASMIDQPLLENGYLLWSDAPERTVDALFQTTYHLVSLEALRAARSVGGE